MVVGDRRELLSRALGREQTVVQSGRGADWADGAALARAAKRRAGSPEGGMRDTEQVSVRTAHQDDETRRSWAVRARRVWLQHQCPYPDTLPPIIAM